MRLIAACMLFVCPLLASDDNIPLPERARLYLTDLLKIDSTNPPGNETRVAEYLKQVADQFGIQNELVGPDPRRLNFVARVKGAGRGRPLLMMAHSDVVPADRAHWSVDPFRGEAIGGFIYGRGALDDKSLLASELAVMVEIRRRNIHLNRDLILLAEADEENGSSGIQWMVSQSFPLIEAEFALNEGGYILETAGGGRVFHIQTSERIPARILLIARSTGRGDNPVVRLSRAVARVAEAEQPVHLTVTSRRYLREMSRLRDFAWLQPLLAKLENPVTAAAAANQIRGRDPEIDSMIRASLYPTALRAGDKLHGIPNVAEAHVEAQRLPGETREEVVARVRQLINDSSVEVEITGGPLVPAAEPSPLATVLYRGMEHTFKTHPEDVVVPYLSSAPTDAPFLRARGIPVYGIPLFVKESGENRAHSTDERISAKNLSDGVELLWQVVLDVSGKE